MDIRRDDLTGKEIRHLLSQHLQNSALHTPSESIFALDLDGLRSAEVTFWSAWDDNVLLGCGALKQITPDHGEIKSMHTCQSQRGKGVASFILNVIIREAKIRKYQRLSLETGAMVAYTAAHRLYQKFGFSQCLPFDCYQDDPHSLFMSLSIVNKGEKGGDE